MPYKPFDMLGLKFGELTPIERFKRIDRWGTFWICQCSCGKKINIRVDKLKKRIINSCGCKRRIQGGISHKKTYWIWYKMKQRCNNPINERYRNYGGRGIKVCPEWENSFPKFYEDMGDRPQGMSLDRIDNNKGYSKDNCRWATFKEQASNRSKTQMTGPFRWSQCHNCKKDIMSEIESTSLRVFKRKREPFRSCLLVEWCVMCMDELETRFPSIALRK